ncbi:TIR domain-containing protein [Cellulosimicrobium sp. MI9406]|uniref:TIR domain-containing protein n=1 Tax=Cellulosimicrobium sp. MI9406 TaxID=2931398 RepID=UPI00339F8E99
MATKRFFISHAGPDKPIALELKDQLHGDAWVDLHEIDLGDILWHEISDGIEAATDFVLLWSRHSAASKWVQYETTLAFTRYLEDSAIALRIVCLDDTKPPLRFRPFLQARNAKTAHEIAAALSRTSPAPVPRRRFFNRNDEIGRIEELLYDSEHVAVWICGVPGSGKRSLAHEALHRLTAGSGTVATIVVTEGTAEPELNLKLASAVHSVPADSDADLTTLVAHSHGLIADFVDAGGVLVFEDAEHWITEDGSYGRLAAQVVDAVFKPGENTDRLIVFTSRRRPKAQQAMASFYLQGLANKHALPLLRSHGAIGSDPELTEIAKELDGHPLALEVIAPQLPLAPTALMDKRHEIATDLIDPARVAPSTWHLLEALSLVDGPLSGEDLAAVLGLSAEDFNAAVDEGTEYSLVRIGHSRTLSLHPLLRDYFLRSYRKNPEYTERTDALASLLVERLSAISTTDETYVATLLSTVKVLGLAGRLGEARDLRQGLIGTLYQTGLELFQERRYDLALQHLQESLTGNAEIDLPANQVIIKTLASLGRLAEAREIGDRLVAENPRNGAVLRDRGRVEQIDRKWREAIQWYERAIPFRRNAAQLYADIAQVRIRLEDWPGAAAAAKTAIDTGGDTPYALSIYSQALEAQGLFPEAKEMMIRAVRREPNNPRYRHRLGRIALRLNDRPRAMEEFKRTIEIDPSFVDSQLSLASMQIDDGAVEDAKVSLAAAEKSPSAPRAVVLNVRAKLALAERDLSGAQATVEEALKAQRDSQNLALAIRILIARAEANEMSVGQAAAQVKLLAKELDSTGGLALVLEHSQRHPKYFE